MKIHLNWTDSMKFEASADNNTVGMDAKSPIGQGSAMTPKELIGAGLAGCTAMDVVALFKKHKQDVKSFDITVDIETTKGVYPAVFTKATLTYIAHGKIDPEIYKEAVVSSQTKYCGVSAMLTKAFPIDYRVLLDDALILEGNAHF